MTKLQATALATLAAALGTASGCSGGGYAIAGRSLDPCLETIPACQPPNQAACVLSATRYAEYWFPGLFQFLVDVERGHEMEVVLFFAEQREPGNATSITWNAPGCSDAEFWDSEGADLFFEARDVGSITRRSVATQTGEHLIQIDSDMQALVLITVNLYIPGT